MSLPPFSKLFLKIGESRASPASSQSINHKGKLLADATVTVQAVSYPTDIGLLNEAREISGQLIDDLSKNQERIDKRRESDTCLWLRPSDLVSKYLDVESTSNSNTWEEILATSQLYWIIWKAARSP